MPKAIPSKVKAQYEEQEDIMEMKRSLARGEITFAKPEGIDRKYFHIRTAKSPDFVRQQKTEGNIQLQEGGLMVFEEEEKQLNAEDAFNS